VGTLAVQHSSKGLWKSPSSFDRMKCCSRQVWKCLLDSEHIGTEVRSIPCEVAIVERRDSGVRPTVGPLAKEEGAR
jgi:hypothetical protein